MHQKPEHRMTLGYIHHERTVMNESWHKECQANGVPKTLRNYLNDTKRIVKEKTGRAMQKKAEDNVIAEAVVVIDEKTTMADLQELGKEMGERFGWTCVQIHIHRDEGYLRERVEQMKHREGKYNLHAHMFFITTNLSTGKSWKRKIGDGSEMQDITAKALNLSRGIRKSDRAEQVKETQNVMQFKEIQAQEQIKQAEEKLEKLEKERAKKSKEVADIVKRTETALKSQNDSERYIDTIEGIKAIKRAEIAKLNDLRDELMDEIEEKDQEIIDRNELVTERIEDERQYSEEVIARHTSSKVLGGKSTNWQAVASELVQRNEMLAEQAEVLREEANIFRYLIEEMGRGFMEFVKDCLRWVERKFTIGEKVQMWLGHSVEDYEHTYTADTENEKLLIDGRTIDQKRYLAYEATSPILAEAAKQLGEDWKNNYAENEWEETQIQGRGLRR